MDSKKRGQLTIFVILGIVIVVGIIGYYVYDSSADDRYFSEANVKEGVNEIKDYLISCTEFVSEDSLDLVTVQAGYYEAPEVYEDFGNGTFLPYYYFEGETYLPNIESVEAEVSKSIDASASGCIDFAEFIGFEVSYSTISSSVDIQDGTVDFVVDMPVKIEQDGHVMILEMKDYPISVDSNFKAMHNVAQYFVNDISDDDEYCVNCLADVATANGVSVDVLGLDSEVSAVAIGDDRYGDGELSYYIFLNKYSSDSYQELDLPTGFDVN